MTVHTAPTGHQPALGHTTSMSHETGRLELETKQRDVVVNYKLHKEIALNCLLMGRIIGLQVKGKNERL